MKTQYSFNVHSIYFIKLTAAQANNQASNHASNQANNQANNQASNQANNQANNHASNHASNRWSFRNSSDIRALPVDFARWGCIQTFVLDRVNHLPRIC